MLNLDAIRKRAAVRASVATPANAANLLTEPISNVAALATVATNSQGANPLMTREQADRAHWPAWDGEEIDRTVSRVHLFMRRGIGADHAEHLAERLLLRDREGDDRRLCLECRHGRATRCPDGAPLPIDMLHRCPRFTP